MQRAQRRYLVVEVQEGNLRPSGSVEVQEGNLRPSGSVEVQEGNLALCARLRFTLPVVSLGVMVHQTFLVPDTLALPTLYRVCRIGSN